MAYIFSCDRYGILGQARGARNPRVEARRSKQGSGVEQKNQGRRAAVRKGGERRPRLLLRPDRQRGVLVWDRERWGVQPSAPSARRCAVAGVSRAHLPPWGGWLWIQSLTSSYEARLQLGGHSPDNTPSASTSSWGFVGAASCACAGSHPGGGGWAPWGLVMSLPT